MLTTIELPLLVGACGLHKPAKDTRCKSAHLQLSFSLRHILLFGKKKGPNREAFLMTTPLHPTPIVLHAESSKLGEGRFGSKCANYEMD